MNERPILFNGEMVRAILDGRKTQTRRNMKPAPDPRIDWIRSDMADVWRAGTKIGEVPEFGSWRCPFGKPDDRLWVRETWRPAIIHSCGLDVCDCDSVGVTYAADGEWRPFSWNSVPAVGDDWTMPAAAARGDVPSIHMPRWACRLVLEITSVRVERLHAISEADALAEGVAASSVEAFANAGVERPAGFAFRDLWTSTGGDWESNPWVWVVEFKKIHG